MTVDLVKVPEFGFILASESEEECRASGRDKPKALLEVAGRSLVDRTLDIYQNAGVKTAVINSCFKSSKIGYKLKDRESPKVIVSEESCLLGTGGGIANCVDILESDNFFFSNVDSLWADSVPEGLLHLAKAWDPSKMDILLMLLPTTSARGYSGQGDYFIDQVGRTKRRRDATVAPYVYTGIGMMSTKMFYEAPEPPFSLNCLFDMAEENNRLYSISHSGVWFHINSPEDIAEAEEVIRGKRQA